MIEHPVSAFNVDVLRAYPRGLLVIQRLVLVSAVLLHKRHKGYLR
jgi:hypothetical protein